MAAFFALQVWPTGRIEQKNMICVHCLHTILISVRLIQVFKNRNNHFSHLLSVRVQIFYSKHGNKNIAGESLFTCLTMESLWDVDCGAVSTAITAILHPFSSGNDNTLENLWKVELELFYFCFHGLLRWISNKSESKPEKQSPLNSKLAKFHLCCYQRS